MPRWRKLNKNKLLRKLLKNLSKGNQPLRSLRARRILLQKRSIKKDKRPLKNNNHLRNLPTKKNLKKIYILKQWKNLHRNLFMKNLRQKSLRKRRMTLIKELIKLLQKLKNLKRRKHRKLKRRNPNLKKKIKEKKNKFNRKNKGGEIKGDTLLRTYLNLNQRHHQ